MESTNQPKRRDLFGFAVKYALFFTLLMVFGGFYSARGTNEYIASVLLLPLLLFIFRLFRARAKGGLAGLSQVGGWLRKFDTLLVVYGLILTTLVSLGGFTYARSSKDILIAVLFLPVTLLMWRVALFRFSGARRFLVRLLSGDTGESQYSQGDAMAKNYPGKMPFAKSAQPRGWNWEEMEKSPELEPEKDQTNKK